LERNRNEHVAVSLPSISESLEANFAGIEWAVTACTLSFASRLLAPLLRGPCYRGGYAVKSPKMRIDA
jgi:hypothetical protein